VRDAGTVHERAVRQTVSTGIRTMSTAVSQKTIDEIMREAHAERARVISELLASATSGLWHLAQRAATLAVGAMSSALQAINQSDEDAYLEGSTNRVERKRRLLILQQRQAQVALDVGH
jgi:hypothetical protein